MSILTIFSLRSYVRLSASGNLLFMSYIIYLSQLFVLHMFLIIEAIEDP